MRTLEPAAAAPPVTDPEYDARARLRRATWSVTPVGPAPVAMDDASVAARLQVMADLAEEGWALLGLPLPVYDRANMPGVFIRRERRR